MKTILLWELKRRRWLIFWWCVGSVLITVFILVLYPPIRDQANQVNQLFNQLPAGIKEMKTGGAATVDVANPASFLSSQLYYITLPILWIILAITRASSLIGKDEQEHTLELLLSRPVSRGHVLLAKGLTLLSEFIIVGGITLLTVIAFAPLFDLHISSFDLALATAYTALFSLSFGVVSFTLQTASNLTRRAASTIAIILSFGGYLVVSLSSLTTWLDSVVKFLPYHYFVPENILNGKPSTGLTIYLASALVLGAAVSYLGFRRRDIE